MRVRKEKKKQIKVSLYTEIVFAPFHNIAAVIIFAHICIFIHFLRPIRKTKRFAYTNHPSYVHIRHALLTDGRATQKGLKILDFIDRDQSVGVHHSRYLRAAHKLPMISAV